ncbi:hypothetical protein [Alloyangia pacifica]|uniref:hypothetical protein n=1 Tax=Alloyangia pacifica TaxID=311180 RepID=UPI001CFF0D00|nr:hypothetical protein [Alloyangia pacifica]
MFNAISETARAYFSTLRFPAACGILALGTALSGPAQASDTLLTVIAAGGQTTELDREALDALPQQEFSTETQWTWEEQSFRGPLLVDVLEMAGLPGPASGGVIEFVADDGYRARVDLTENAQYLTDAYPIITTRINGEPFPLEENGPLWVMFPYDAQPELDVEAVHSMTVWQLLQIVEVAE